jgi:hypothetical protein
MREVWVTQHKMSKPVDGGGAVEEGGGEGEEEEVSNALNRPLVDSPIELA